MGGQGVGGPGDAGDVFLPREQVPGRRVRACPRTFRPSSLYCQKTNTACVCQEVHWVSFHICSLAGPERHSGARLAQQGDLQLHLVLHCHEEPSLEPTTSENK